MAGKTVAVTTRVGTLLSFFISTTFRQDPKANFTYPGANAIEGTSRVARIWPLMINDENLILATCFQI